MTIENELYEEIACEEVPNHWDTVVDHLIQRQAKQTERTFKEIRTDPVQFPRLPERRSLQLA